jgi:outer membrane protein OmpA-like peptidoglycan-associated protein
MRRVDGFKVLGSALLAVALAACSDPPPPQPPPQPPPAPAPPPAPPPPAYTLEVGVNYSTPPIDLHPETDPQACAKACDTNPKCWVASFHDATVPTEKYRNTCALRPWLEGRKDAPGVSSWVKPGAPPPPPPPVVVERVVVNEGRIALNEEILFKTGSAEIDPKSDEYLVFIARIIKEHEGLDFIEIAGHTDKTGDEASNLKLSKARAESVLKHIIADGVNPKRLRAAGYGPFCPIDPASTEEAYHKNRRVEFAILRRNGRDRAEKWGGCDNALAHKLKPAPIPASAPRTKEYVVKKAKIVRKGFDLVFSDQVRFEPRTANIVEGTIPVLAELKVFLDKSPNVTKVRVEGHTDPPNTPELLALSKARSIKVAEWLVNHGVDKNRLIPVGCGGNRPILKGAAVDENASRRVEVHVVEENGKQVSSPVPGDCSAD